MLKHSWLQALCAALCVLALTGCGGDECTTQSECTDKKGAAPDGKQWLCNAQHACELEDAPPTEVKCSPTCAASDFCDTSSGTGVCRTCSATQGCAAPLFCDAAANSGKGVCRTCSDTATGNELDQGCSATTPVCDAAAGSGLGLCKACVDSGSGTDVGCTATTPVCDTTAASGAGVCKACQDTVSGNGQDSGCSATTPVCDGTAANGSGVCRACQDTANGNAQDLGCTATAPVCDAAGASGAGVCHACQDTATGNAQDLGCPATAPVCDAAAASGVGVCHACQDTATGNAQDLGCSAAAPVCDAAAASGAGVCKACLDSASGNAQDLGCSASAPICNAAAANGVGVCKACLDSATGTAQDLGCSAAAPLCEATAASGAGACRACLDSATGAGTDLGCAVASPLCDTAAASGAGLCRVCMDSAAGNTQDMGCSANVPLCDATAASGSGACRVCLDSASGGNPDQGCVAPTTFCTASANNGVGACSVCVTASNEGCPGAQTCNATGTACEGCVDDTSCTNPSTPICKPPPPVAVCVECTSSANCSAARPTCDMATNFCGCANDAACAAAPGNTDFCDTAANTGRGECRVCVTDANCASVDVTTPFCDNQTSCVQCRTTADCSLTQTCNASKLCVAPPGADPTTTSSQIQAFIDAPVGMISPALTIENAFVTYIKPLLGTDVAGFFLQAEANGPAMFVAVDASSFSLQVGDRITLTVGEVQKLSGDLEAAATVSNLTIVSRGAPVQNLNTAPRPGLAVDRSGASDLQTNLSAYESELISLTGTIASTANTSGTGHTAFNITTAGMTTSAGNFRLRVPDTVADSMDIALGCAFTLKAGPMWRFSSGTPVINNAQPSAYSASDLTLTSCPAPKVLTAAPLSINQVVITLDRRLDAASVASNGAQFTFTNGLSATAAVVSGRQVTLTTSNQTAGADYIVTVAASVKDLLGNGVSATANTATFKGFRVGALLRINEVQPSIAGGADLVELLATTGGTVENFVLQQDINSATVLATLPNVTVSTGDIIVVHMTPSAGYASETTAKNQFPASTTPVNYDAAWDFAGNAVGITFSNRLIIIKDSVGAIQDAAPFVKTDLPTPPSGFPANLQALQATGQWMPADCGGTLCTYTSTPTAQAVSADWTTIPTSATRTSNTVRRVSATDTNTKADWAVGAQSLGLPNP